MSKGAPIRRDVPTLLAFLSRAGINFPLVCAFAAQQFHLALSSAYTRAWVESAFLRAEESDGCCINVGEIEGVAEQRRLNGVSELYYSCVPVISECCRMVMSPVFFQPGLCGPEEVAG